MIRFRIAGVAAAAALAAHTAAAWTTIFQSDFSSASGWTYAGVTDVNSQALIRVDPLNHNVSATWDAALGLDTAPDPMAIKTSSLSAPLGRTLTDANSFRVRTTLRIDGLALRDYYQIANFGLFNPSAMGDDRTFIDDTLTFDGANWVPLFNKTSLVPNPVNLVEFNYFIGELYGGPGVQPNIIGGDGTFAYGANVHLLGSDTLPTGQALYAELVYTADTRTATVTVYTDAGYTQVLQVGGVPLTESSQIALAAGSGFTVTHVGFFNYQAIDWTGNPLEGVGGTGAFDDLSVDIVPEPGASALGAAGLLALAGAARRRQRTQRTG